MLTDYTYTCQRWAIPLQSVRLLTHGSLTTDVKHRKNRNLATNIHREKKKKSENENYMFKNISYSITSIKNMMKTYEQVIL